MEKVHDRYRFRILIISLISNLSLLGFFKYFNFFITSTQDLAQKLDLQVNIDTLNIILPIGISFYTFQTMSYSIDVYQRKIVACKNFFDFALFVSFFPQLIAGPIERAGHLLPQIYNKRMIDLHLVLFNFQLIIIGFFKKMVVADNMALVVNAVFLSKNSPSVMDFVVASYAFAFQIYGDFSGYSDIAIGTAGLFGITLSRNFNMPFLANGPSEFWKRWHISLSSWLKDYVYIPLGGNRQGHLRTKINLFITMLLGGLWHGASYNYLLWGAYHGILLIIAKMTVLRNLEHIFSKTIFLSTLRILLFFCLGCVGWLIFRLNDINSQKLFINALSNHNWFSFTLSKTMIMYTVIFSLPVIGFHILQFSKNEFRIWKNWPLPVLVIFNIVLLYSIILLGSPETEEFIYFQF